MSINVDGPVRTVFSLRARAFKFYNLQGYNLQGYNLQGAS